MSFVPSTSIVSAKGATPVRVAYVLHGILGSGRNWRTLCRRLVRERPDTAYVLVDLRNHGDSQGAPPPHTLASAADDLVALHDVVGAPHEVIGHSFGGKVALTYAARHPDGLERVWVLDSRADAEPPEADNDVALVFGALRHVPLPLPDRDALVTHLMGQGFSEMLSRWMTTNLVRTEDRSGFTWVFDLDAVEAMIQDYWQTDRWDVLREPPCRIDVVRAGRGDRWPESVLSRYATEAGAEVHLHVLPDAGHWVHVDDPAGVIRLLSGAEDDR